MNGSVEFQMRVYCFSFDLLTYFPTNPTMNNVVLLLLFGLVKVAIEVTTLLNLKHLHESQTSSH